MTRRATGVRGTSRTDRDVILIFGESITDTKAISHLVRGLRPDLPTPAPRHRPIILDRSSNQRKRKSVADDIARLAKAELIAGRNIKSIIIHRDHDKIETDDNIDAWAPNGSGSHGDVLSQDIQQALKDHKVSAAPIAIVVAFELESWWLMWPDAVAAHRGCWRPLPDRTGKRVDRIENAKETLRREVRPTTKINYPEYSETDGPLIAEKIVALAQINKPKGVSISYARFMKQVNDL